MHTITLEIAKTNYQLGYLVGYRFHRSVSGKGWKVGITDGAQEMFLSAARKSLEPRVYLTLDSAVSAVEAVGFEVNVVTSF